MHTRSSLLTLLLITLIIAACKNYYMATRIKSGSAETNAGSLDSLSKLNRYFILRNGDQPFYISQISLSEDRKTASCMLDSVSRDHQLHFTKGTTGKMDYNKHLAADRNIFSEVHFYIQKDSSAHTGQYTLNLEKINRIEIIEVDKKRTTNSYVLGTVGYTLGGLALAGVIIALTKSSCPFVSAYTDNGFLLQGEIYGGAIYPQLARHDFMPLRLSPDPEGEYEVKISNELKERQFTDMAELWVVGHDEHTKVLCDEQGLLHTITEPHTPELAILDGNRNVTPALLTRDDNYLLHFDDTSTVNGMNEVTLRFPQPVNSVKGKLVLTLKNSYWLDYLYGELAKHLGDYYPAYVAEQKKKTGAELAKWVTDQRLPLEISVKTKAGWTRRSAVTTIGPLATREIVVPLDLSDVQGEPLQIRLSSGLLFWEIDYAAMDYSEDKPLKPERLMPFSATDEQNRDVRGLLSNEDGNYLEQPEIGNVVTLRYRSAGTGNGQTRSYFFHTKGYYEHIRSFSGKPDIAFLKQFTQPGRFALFAKEAYQKMNDHPLISLAAHH